jgi:hypothetical protein
MTEALALPLAQVVAGYGLVHLLILVIIIAAVIAVVMVFVRQSGVNVPPAVSAILWIVGLAALAIIAIRFLVSL